MSAFMGEGIHNIPHDTLTRSQLYELRGEEPPATNGDEPSSSGRSCRQCGASLEGRAPATKWCSETCRRHARNGNTSRTREEPRHTSPKPEPETAEDRLAELVGIVAQAVGDDARAVTFEVDDISITIGRV
jgi:hypothetical protein